ncbi:MAG: hypothetical protein EOM37_12310 [Proteobacteria bacterium]|nr:hypothetical protein [Pseudomonadota bacterium]
MSEIERAIIEVRAAQKQERRITLADGTQMSKERISIPTLELVEKLCRAELEREKSPLTCDGCKNQEGMYVDDNLCYDCRRYETLPDRYEPKGEKA